MFFFLVRSDKNAGDDVQSMVEKEILADSEISMTTAGSHSLLSCQCHDLYYPRDQAPMVGTLPVHERTAILIIVDSATAHRKPSDGDRRRTQEELEIIGYHTLCEQARKQLSR